MNFDFFFKSKNNPKNIGNTNLDDFLSKINNPGRFRVSLLNDQEKDKIKELINSGQELDLERIQSLIGKKRKKEIHWQSVGLNLEEKEEIKKSRKNELINSGKDKEPFLLEEKSFNVVSIHDLGGSLEDKDIIKEIPSSLKGDSINVAYQENTSSNSDDVSSREYGNKDSVIQMFDSSGRISSNYLRDFFDIHQNSSFIMTGGNLRGCFLESLRGVVKEARKNKFNKVDFHIPLNKCYDDPVYEKITGFKDLPEALSKTSLDNSEIYQNGDLIEVAVGSQEDINSNLRYYFWDDDKLMTDKIKEQFENRGEDVDKKASFNDFVSAEKTKDGKALSKIRKEISEI